MLRSLTAIRLLPLLNFHSEPQLMSQGNRSSIVTIISLTRSSLQWIAVVVMIALMFFTFADVMLRYSLSLPIRGGLEITEMMLATVIFLGLPLTTAAREHVTLDTLDEFMPPWSRAALDTLAQIICSVMVFGASWLIAMRAIRLAEDNDVTSQLLLPLWPIVALIAVALTMSAIVHLVLGITILQSMMDGQTRANSEPDRSQPESVL